MATNKTLSSLIDHTEYNLAKYKLVMEKFPDAKLINDYFYNRQSPFYAVTSFKSKYVNKNYSNYEFAKNYKSLYIKAYTLLPFSFNGKSEDIKIFTNPTNIKLLYTDHAYINRQYKYTIRFTKFYNSLKSKEFDEAFFNDCRINIIAFIKEHPTYEINEKFLEPRLKKLLLLS